MALTAEQLATLKRPFARADHEFLRSFVYLTEEAITTRIEEVDPSWEFAVLQVSQSGNQAVTHARMTICGVFRDGIGMQQVNEKAGEAEKGAATDALKRCARLFGVGRYLLDAPKEDEFNKWLAEQQKAHGGAQKPPPAQPPPQAPSAQPALAGGAQTAVPKDAPSANTPSTAPIPASGASDSPVKTYLCTEIRVVKFGRGKQAQLKRADGGDPIVLLGSEKLRAAGYPDEAVDWWIANVDTWFPLKPCAAVEAAFDGGAWDVGSIRIDDLAKEGAR